MSPFIQQSLIISSMIQLVLAGVCILRRRHKQLSRLYSYYSLALFGMGLSAFIEIPLQNWQSGHLLIINLPLAGILFYHFVSAFVSELPKQKTVALGFYYVGWLFLAIATWKETNIGLILWSASALLGIPPTIYAFEQIFLRIRTSFSRLEKRQLAYLAAGFGVFVLGIGLDLIFGQILLLGSIGLLGLAMATSLSILRYKFLDLSIQLGRGIGILIAAYLLWLAYTETVFFIESTNNNILEPRNVSIFQLTMASGVILMLFEPLKKIFIDLMEPVLTKESYNFQRELTALSSSLVSVLDLYELFEKVARALSSSPRVAYAEIFLAKAETEDFRNFVSSSSPVTLRIERNNPLVELLSQEHKVLALDEMERSVQLFYPSEQQKLISMAARILRELKGEIIVPLRFQNKLSGFIILTSARDKGLFTAREREILLSLGGQLAITVENARIYDQMRQRDRLAAVGEMATGLAHEIRNPLGSIKAAAQYIEPGMVVSEDREFLSILIEEVDRLNNVVTRFLDYARPLTLRLSTFNLNQIVQRVSTLMAPEAASRNIEFSIQTDPALPEMYLDGEQIRQVLLNLILNAIDAIPQTGPGKIRISTQFLAPAKDEDHLGEAKLTLEDSGQGIPESDIDKIFTPFYTTKSSGNGLGLAIAYRIIQAHGGFVSVQSQIGLGTTFEIRIPIQIDPEAVQPITKSGASVVQDP